MSGPLDTCPACGGETFDAVYTTGAGWRVSGYRCRDCGYRTTPSRTKQAATVVTAAALAVALAAAVRRWLS